MSTSSPPAPAPTSPPATPSPPSPPSAPSPSNNSTSPPPSSPPPAPSPPTPVPSSPPSSSPPSPSPPSPPSSPSPSSPSTPSPPSSPSPSSPSTPSPPSSPSPSSPSTPSPPSSPSPPPPSTGRSPPVSPSPPSAKTPPSSVKTPPPPSPSQSSSSSISTLTVVGIAIAGVALLAALTVLYFCCRSRKKRPPLPPPVYYGGHPPQQPPPPPVKDDFYGGQVHNWQHNAPPADHVVKIPSDPSPPPPFPSRPPNSPFLPPPPPPPPMMSSSGGSGSNYSGSDNALPPPSPGTALGFPKGTFTFDELVRATDGFSEANLLGQGGFGYVHKGILPNGKEIAIKQLKTGSVQGEREFQAEVRIISRVHHKNLVTLVGHCDSDGQRLLVYEFVPNRTLEFHLHGKDQPTMDWPTRLKIALGSARGLAYLHEDCHPKIIHRDIKAANILLEYNFEAKVADFGLARLTSDNNTHISTRVMGTFGYLAPEYASSGKLTDKSDVFSFGVMLLELITGRRPVDSTYSFMDDSLVDWARPLMTRAIEDGDCSPLIDPKLGDNYNYEEVARMVACAAACVRHSAKRRPRMGMVVRTLEGDASLADLNDGVTPGHSSVYGSSDYDTSQYNEDMKKFRKVLDSRDYSTSEYSAPTSEYGQNPSVSSSEGQQTQEMDMNRFKKDSRGFNSGL